MHLKRQCCAIDVRGYDWSDMARKEIQANMALRQSQNLAKDLSEMLESQITYKSKKGVGYHAVPSPHTLILNRPTPLDLSYSGLEEFKEPEVNEYGPRDSSLKPSIGLDKSQYNSKENTDDSLEQHQKTDTETSSVKSSLKSNSQLNDKGFIDSGCSRHMTGNITHLSDFKDFDGGYVTSGN
ncbi:hypothetical protein Tco_0006865 [Tanacetum coccineum]